MFWPWVLLQNFYCPSYQPGSQNTTTPVQGGSAESHALNLSIFVYLPTSVWKKGLGKISVSTAHYWAKQAQRNRLRALEPKYRSCLPLNSFDISVEPKRTFIGQSNTNSRCCKRATSSAPMPRAEGSTSWFIKSWNCLVIFQTPGCERASTGQLTARKIQVCRQAFDRAATSASLPSDKDHHSPLLFWVSSKIPPFIALEWNKFSLL